MTDFNVKLRKFLKSDIPNKVSWINNPENNRYLHYDLPLSINKSNLWFEKNQNNPSRYDAVIEYKNIPVGIIGILSIKNGKGEYYITIGEQTAKGKGIARQATYQLINYAFETLCLNEIYLYTEVDNIAAQKLFEKCGFKKKFIEKQSALNRGKAVDRYFYSITKNEFSEK